MRRSLAVVLVAGALAPALPAAGWAPATQLAIVREAARLAPADLRRQVEKHDEELRAGVLAPFREADPDLHYWHPDGSGELDSAAFRAVAETIDAIRGHEPFERVVFRLGVVSHYLADANNPLAAADADPREGHFAADYLRYAATAEPRFARVFYAGEPMVDDDRAMRLMAYRALHRGRELYPLVGGEYRRIGYGSGLGVFDDRSTAFGVAAVAFNHAVSDVARALRYIWVAAGGTDEGSLLGERRRGLLLLSSGGLTVR